MKITWFGTASILLETKNTSLLFDPYLKDLPRSMRIKDDEEKRMTAFSGQRNIFITHGHFDHLASLKNIYVEKDCSIYATKTPIETLKKQGFKTEKLHQIEVGENIQIGDMCVKALKGLHVQFVKKEVAKSIFAFKNLKYLFRSARLGVCFFKYPENDEIVVFEVEAEGKVVQIMGSAGIVQSENYKKNADCLILPHQGRSDIDEHNEKIVQFLKPKRVLLDHYDNAFPPFSADISVEKFCEQTSQIILTQKLIEFKTIEI